MADLNGFDANALPSPAADHGSGLVPPGRYEAVASASEMRRSRNGNATYLEVELELTAGEHRGRRLWDRFMMEHSTSGRAVELGRRKLASLCRAVGVDSPSDSSELHGIPVTAVVVQEVRKDTGDVVNRVKGYEPMPRPSSGPLPTDRTRPADGHAGGTSRKPWDRSIPI